MNKTTSNQYALEMRHINVERGAFIMRVAEMTLQPGEIACIVGTNGSGKTSLLLTALGLLPHEGICRVNGAYFDGSQLPIKARIGFVPDDPDILFSELTAYEQWAVTASVLAAAGRGEKATLLTRAAKLARLLSFDPPPKPAREYSHGMRRKTQIVNALLGKPSILVVDELRNGLDPIAITQAEELVKDERRRGAAILTASHDLWWAERFADRVYVMDAGRIIAAGTCGQLLQPGEKHLEEAFSRLIGARR